MVVKVQMTPCWRRTFQGRGKSDRLRPFSRGPAYGHRRVTESEALLPQYESDAMAVMASSLHPSSRRTAGGVTAKVSVCCGMLYVNKKKKLSNHDGHDENFAW